MKQKRKRSLTSSKYIDEIRRTANNAKKIGFKLFVSLITIQATKFRIRSIHIEYIELVNGL